MADIDGAGCPIAKPIAARPHIVRCVEHLKSVVSHNSMLFVSRSSMGSFPYERVGAAAMGVPLELCARVMIKRANLEV